MNNKPSAALESTNLTYETLRAFAKGQLDEESEQRIMSLLESRPDLAAKIAAISSDSVVGKMRSFSQSAVNDSASRKRSPASAAASIPPTQQHISDAPSAELAALTDFKVLKEIGRGGMGVAYLAEHLLTGRKEVLKVLNEGLVTNDAARRRFNQEIKCIAAMNHESIVRCYTVKQLPATLVLCMEYVPGENLHHFINAHGPLSMRMACEVATDICRGLQHAMNSGLVHRDIKPSNIMLYKHEGRMRAKILDFGLARFSAGRQGKPGAPRKGLTDDGTLLGTVEYIAPEQCIHAASADIRSDIYSLGCTLYHMLVGHPPFSGSTGAVILAHSQTTPPAINVIRPDLCDELANVVAKMLAKAPSRRYATPEQVAEALNAIQIGLESADVPSPLSPARQAIIDTRVDAQRLVDTSVAQHRAETKGSEGGWLNYPPNRWLRLGTLALSLALILGIVLIIDSPAGSIVISNLPDDAVVLVDGDRVTVRRDGDTGTIRVTEGEREITVTRTGIALLGTTVHLAPGATKRFRLRQTEPNENGGPFLDTHPHPVVRRLPDLRHRLPNQPTFRNLMAKQETLTSHFDSERGNLQFDPVESVVRIGGGDEQIFMLTTKRADFRNFHLRVQMQIESTSEAAQWNQHFVLRAENRNANQTGWRFMLGGNRPHAGVYHEVAPFGLMDLKVKPFPGFPRGTIGGQQLTGQRITFFQAGLQDAMTRGKFHTIEYIAYGRTVDAFLDGRFVCSASDDFDRADRGAISLMKSPHATDSIREFSILELGDDTTAEDYATAMALTLAKD